MRAVARSFVPVALAIGAALALPRPAAACLAYSDPVDTADFDGLPHVALIATASAGGPPSDDRFTFADVLPLRGAYPSPFTLGPADGWDCHGADFRRGDRVLILSWARLPNVGLPLVWRVGPAGEILNGVGFTPRLDGHEPATLAEILNHFGIEVPDAAMAGPRNDSSTPIGFALLAVASGLAVIRGSASRRFARARP
jgi:hypothetical protein